MRWKASHPQSEFPSLPQKIVPSKNPYPSMVVSHFSSIQVAGMFTLYQAVVILFNQFISSLSPLHEEAASEQIATSTTDILKSIDFHLSHAEASSSSAFGTSGLRNIYLLLPLRVAYRVLSQSNKAQDLSKKLWLEDVLHFISSRAGPWMSTKHIFDAWLLQSCPNFRGKMTIWASL